MKKLSGWLLLSACVALTGCPGGGNDGGMGGGSGGGHLGGGGGSVGGGSATGGGTGTGGGGGGGGGMDAGVPIGQFCTQYAQKLCTHDSQCLKLDSAQQLGCQGVVKQDCQTRVDQVTKGQRKYDPTLVQKCFDALNALDCRQDRVIDPQGYPIALNECDAVFVQAAAALGHSCANDSDCVNGYCPGTNGACQVCVPFVALNQPCDFSNPCDPTAFCNDSNVCQTRIAQGMGPCVDFPNGCVNGTYCTPGNDDGGTDDGGLRTCLATVADGQPCTSYSQCTTGHCNSNSTLPDAGPDTCGYNPTGGPCQYSSDCVGRDYCVGGVCVAPGTNLSVGADCYYDQECQFDLWCADNPDGGTGYNCQPRVDAGSPCMFDSNCIQGEECDFFNTGLCEVMGKAGEPCIDVANMGQPDSYMCKELLFCNDPGDGGVATCAEWLNPGADCSNSEAVCSDGMNGKGICNDATDGGPTCGLGAAGESCSDNFKCTSLRCLQDDGGYLDVNTPVGTCAAACP